MAPSMVQKLICHSRRRTALGVQAEDRLPHRMDTVEIRT